MVERAEAYTTLIGIGPLMTITFTAARGCLAATVVFRFLGLSLRQPGIILMLGRPLFKKGMMAFLGLVRAVEETGGLARQLL